MVDVIPLPPGATLVLASASPRRADLLRSVGLEFVVRPSDLDETIHDGESPADYVRRLSLEKALAAGAGASAARQWPSSTPAPPASEPAGEVEVVSAADTTVEPAGEVEVVSAADTTVQPSSEVEVVLAADTTVEVAGRVLGKPADAEDARRMLRALSGRRHQVHTGVTVTTAAGPSRTQIVTTTVEFTTLDDATITWYVDTGEPFGKAGAYAIQGAGGALVARVDGSVTNVIGLPLAETLELLRTTFPVHP